MSQFYAWHVYLDDGNDIVVSVEHGIFYGAVLKVDDEIVAETTSALKNSQNWLHHTLPNGSEIDCLVKSYAVAFSYDLFIDSHSPYTNQFKPGTLGESSTSKFPVASVIAMVALVIVSFVMGFLFGVFALVPILAIVIVSCLVSTCISFARRRRLPVEPRFEHSPVVLDEGDIVLHAYDDNNNNNNYNSNEKMYPPAAFGMADYANTTDSASLMANDIVAGSFAATDDTEFHAPAGFAPPPPDTYTFDYDHSIVEPPSVISYAHEEVEEGHATF